MTMTTIDWRLSYQSSRSDITEKISIHIPVLVLLARPSVGEKGSGEIWFFVLSVKLLVTSASDKRRKCRFASCEHQKRL